MTSQGSDRLGGRGPAQPLADPAADNEAEYDETGAVVHATGHGLRLRSTDQKPEGTAIPARIPATRASAPTVTLQIEGISRDFR